MRGGKASVCVIWESARGRKEGRTEEDQVKADHAQDARVGLLVPRRVRFLVHCVCATNVSSAPARERRRRREEELEEEARESDARFAPMMAETWTDML